MARISHPTSPHNRRAWASARGVANGQAEEQAPPNAVPVAPAYQRGQRVLVQYHKDIWIGGTVIRQFYSKLQARRVVEVEYYAADGSPGRNTFADHDVRPVG
ncbi:hypothetical protein C8Q79DRAFT_948763 [Trametes meyenii]|nr:hypothetical protein C8Q79DRAFT_948763 [Trametes meyenii]